MKCLKCGEEIPEGRLKALPTAKTCVDCSKTGKVRSITTLNGEGEDTWNDIVFVSPETYSGLGMEPKNTLPYEEE